MCSWGCCRQVDCMVYLQSQNTDKTLLTEWQRMAAKESLEKLGEMIRISSDVQQNLHNVQNVQNRNLCLWSSPHHASLLPRSGSPAAHFSRFRDVWYMLVYHVWKHMYVYIHHTAKPKPVPEMPVSPYRHVENCLRVSKDIKGILAVLRVSSVFGGLQEAGLATYSSFQFLFSTCQCYCRIPKASTTQDYNGHQVRHCLTMFNRHPFPKQTSKRTAGSSPCNATGGTQSRLLSSKIARVSSFTKKPAGTGSHDVSCLRKKVYHRKTPPWHDLIWSDEIWQTLCRMLQNATSLLPDVLIRAQPLHVSHLSFQQIVDCIVVVLLCPCHSVPKMHMRRPHRSKRLGTGRSGVRSPWRVTIRAFQSTSEHFHDFMAEPERTQKDPANSANLLEELPKNPIGNPIAFWFSKARCEWRHESQHALHKRIELQGFLAWMTWGSSEKRSVAACFTPSRVFACGLTWHKMMQV